MDVNKRIELLQQKIELLSLRQQQFSEEINNLKKELSEIRKLGEQFPVIKDNVIPEKEVVSEVFEDSNLELEHHKTTVDFVVEKIDSKENQAETISLENKPKQKSDIEKFIGENLISKIGIAVTVIGVAIGVKYSIEKELISPLTRIILGYFFGAGLFGLAIKLKAKYENYSAVLLSGAMAIMYFITFTAYSFYGLIPQTLAFGLMVVFTIFTVIASLRYNKQVIALFGMVGAYTVPFLLSDGSGKVAILFSYMTIINVGILIIAFKKYWKSLFYCSFIFTWLIYASWYFFKYEEELHFDLAFFFLVLFFAIFYGVFLAYKLVKKEVLKPKDTLMVLVNSFVFYGFGYAILSSKETTSHFLGLFTLANAFIHAVICVIIYNKKLANKALFYMVSGIALLFITIAIPVQLDGNWVTLLWTGEAAILFWIGRTKKISFYEKVSYPMMLIAFFSLVYDWQDYYFQSSPEYIYQPIFNSVFLTSILFLITFAFINKTNWNKKYASEFSSYNQTPKLFNFYLAALLILASYFTFQLEIQQYWDQLYYNSMIRVTSEVSNDVIIYNENYMYFEDIWLVNYSLLFFSALSYFNLRRTKSTTLGLLTIFLLFITVWAFLALELPFLDKLAYNYLNRDSEHFNIGIEAILIRYTSYAFVALALAITYKNVQENAFLNKYKKVFYVLFCIAILWILSDELIHLMNMAHSTQSDKLGLSILWGIFAFVLAAIGIWKKKKYLRYMAFVLFGITLLKLFLYDIAELSTISKTIVMVVLGLLLLVISFLYNKYKNNISDEKE